MAWLAIKPGPPPLTAVLRASLAIKSDLVLALAVNIVNLIPGSIVLEIDQARRLHLCARHRRRLGRVRRPVLPPDLRSERLLVAAFERDTEWRPVPKEETA